MNKYYWIGRFQHYEVDRFEYNEDKKLLILYTPLNEIITEIDFKDSDIDLSTYIDEEINEYLLENFEEYVDISTDVYGV